MRLLHGVAADRPLMGSLPVSKNAETENRRNVSRYYPVQPRLCTLIAPKRCCMEIFFLVFCTLYISDPASGAGPTLPVLAQILGVSDRNNRRDCITGLLIAHERRFMQVAEGARADVEALMTRLTSDQRHRNIRVLTFR